MSNALAAYIELLPKLHSDTLSLTKQVAEIKNDNIRLVAECNQLRIELANAINVINTATYNYVENRDFMQEYITKLGVKV